MRAATSPRLPRRYEEQWKRSIDPATKDAFWAEQSSQFIDWIRPYDTVTTGGFEVGDQAWFVGGQLNVSACCLDKHLATKGSKPCIIWEADEPGQSETLSYLEVFHGTCRVRAPRGTQKRRRGAAAGARAGWSEGTGPRRRRGGAGSRVGRLGPRRRAFGSPGRSPTR